MDEVTELFDKMTHEYCIKTKGLYCEISQYGKNVHAAIIYYPLFLLIFKLTLNCHFTNIRNVLECSVAFDKIGNTEIYPLQIISCYVDKCNLMPITIPFVINEKIMKNALETLFCTVNDLFEDIKNISLDPEQKERVAEAYTKELSIAFNKKTFTEEERIMSSNAYINWITGYYSTPPYFDIMKGKYKDALKKLKKRKLHTGYENNIILLLEKDDTYHKRDVFDEPELDEYKYLLNSYNSLGAPKTNVKELIALFLSWFALTIVLLPLYYLLYLGLVQVESIGVVYLMGPMTNVPCVFLPAFITAISSSYFIRQKMYKILFRKSYEKYTLVDSAQNSRKTDKVMKGFQYTVITLGLAFIVIMVNNNIAFKEKGFTDNTAVFSLEGPYYLYSDIDKVYYLPTRVNAYDEVLEYPSYVILLKNGKKLDLYTYDDIDNYSDFLINMLKEKGVNVQSE